MLCRIVSDVDAAATDGTDGDAVAVITQVGVTGTGRGSVSKASAIRLLGGAYSCIDSIALGLIRRLILNI